MNKKCAISLLFISSLLTLSCFQSEPKTINQIDTVYIKDTIDGTVLIGDYSPINIGSKWRYNLFHWFQDLGTFATLTDSGLYEVTIQNVGSDYIYLLISYNYLRKSRGNPSLTYDSNIVFDSIITIPISEPLEEYGIRYRYPNKLPFNKHHLKEIDSLEIGFYNGNKTYILSDTVNTSLININKYIPNIGMVNYSNRSGLGSRPVLNESLELISYEK